MEELKRKQSKQGRCGCVSWPARAAAPPPPTHEPASPTAQATPRALRHRLAPSPTAGRNRCLAAARLWCCRVLGRRAPPLELVGVGAWGQSV